MIVVNKLSEAKDWCGEIVKEIAPKDFEYFCLIPDQSSASNADFDLAHDTMLGLALLGKGSGTLIIRRIERDYFFDQAMVAFFV